MDDPQRKVILKNKLNSLKANINNLVFNMKIESETRSKLLFDAIPKLTDVSNFISPHGILELIYLEINALINALAVALIGTHSKDDI